MFASLFQFSNCTPGTQVHTFTPEWEAQEDSRVRRHSEPPTQTWCCVGKKLFDSFEVVCLTQREGNIFLI